MLPMLPMLPMHHSAGGTKTINVNSNSNRANAKEDGRDVLDDGDQEEEGAATGKDNQLYGVLEALLDLRWVELQLLRMHTVYISSIV